MTRTCEGLTRAIDIINADIAAALIGAETYAAAAVLLGRRNSLMGQRAEAAREAECDTVARRMWRHLEEQARVAR
jgi:hypothetical protein